MLRNWFKNKAPPKSSFARELRRNQTRGEELLWYAFKSRRFHGLKFRRQVPIGSHIVDFLCVEKRLIIEVDGDTHFEPGARQRDQKRATMLRQQGFKIFRCGNGAVIEDVNAILERLAEFLEVVTD
jgi:very-short-patch-repair endonuclease